MEQAGNAIRLYTDHFLSGNTASLSPDSQQVPETNKPDAGKILEKLREAIRIKHYSYSTERTYLDWCRRFFAYLEETKKNSLTAGFDETQVRDYLSHLAIRQRVSSATQNQAFNALLFLFREVLKIVATAVRKAGIAKHATVHTLRHSFATHLLISGVNIREVQELLGHKNVETTMIYSHVVRNMSKAPESPLDNLLRRSSEKEQAEKGNPAP